jgi:CO/xanthine dehydrogenase Mo-binding subunit
MPDGYFFVDYRDVPGVNIAHVVLDDSPVFEEDEVKYIGDQVALIVGPELKVVRELVEATEVVYEQLPALLDIDDSDTNFFDYHYGRGDVDQAFADADKIYEEGFETGYQEQAYLEPQALISSFIDGVITVRGSMQCPYYVQAAVAQAMGFEADKVRIIQDYTGGGFGGKEAYPSILGCQLAVAAYKANGKQVRIVFERREDMEFTSKRHPSRSRYKIAVKDGKVTAMDIDVRFNSGAYTTLSPVVLQRGIIAAPGVYNVPNLKVRGRGVYTNTVPTGAYRGFGAPQTFFAVELMMEHIARDLGVDSVTFKRSQLVVQGDATTTGGTYFFPVPLPAMIDEVLASSDYEKKRAVFNQPQEGRYRRGIGLAMWFHGAGFTGSAEQDFIKGVAQLHKRADGRVEVLHSQSDIGQGIKSTLAKIVAHELDLDPSQIIVMNPDTFKVPNSGPTVGSRSLMIVGELMRRAAIKLREEWVDGQDQLVEEHYVAPEFQETFNLDDFTGDAYPTYAWGVSAVELSIDSATGTHEIVGSWSSFDVGTPIDLAIVTGQMEGGVLQGLGYSAMEQMAIDGKGRIRNNSYSDYIIPTAQDVGELDIQLHVEEYPNGPYGAKGAGELPLVGIPAAYIAAAEQALGGQNLHHIPLKAEETLELFTDAKKEAIA